MDAFSHTSLFSGPTMGFDQSTENCSVARLRQVACRMFYSSKIHNTGYILLKRTLLKIETLRKMFAIVSLQAKNIRELS